jgi:hypothetical protein
LVARRPEAPYPFGERVLGIPGDTNIVEPEIGEQRRQSAGCFDVADVASGAVLAKFDQAVEFLRAQDVLRI